MLFLVDVGSCKRNVFASFTEASRRKWTDSTTPYHVLGPNRYMVIEEFPDLTRRTTKATQLYFTSEVGEDVIKLRWAVPSNKCVKLHTVFLSKDTNFICQAAVRGPVGEIIVGGAW